MGCREKDARRQRRHNHRQPRFHAGAAESPGHKRKQYQPEQQFLVNARPEESDRQAELIADVQADRGLKCRRQRALKEQDQSQAYGQQDAFRGHGGEDSAGESPRLARDMVPRQEEADGQQRQHEMLAESQPVEQPGQNASAPFRTPSKSTPSS